jgi:hypothetical protein
MAAATRKDALMDMSMPPNEFHDMMQPHMHGRNYHDSFHHPSKSVELEEHKSMTGMGIHRAAPKRAKRSKKSSGVKSVRRHKSVVKALKKTTKKRGSTR